MKICICCLRKMGDAQFRTPDGQSEECKTCRSLTFDRKVTFIRRMIKQGHQPEILLTAYYAGGDCHGTEKNINKSHDNYYVRNWMSIFNRPERRTHCLCGHWITNQCYIYNKTKKIAYVIGNCCINRFVGGKRCYECNKKHRNIITKYCNDCRKIFLE